MADIALLVAIIITGYLVAAEGAWSAAIVFIGSIIAALIATSYFESLAIFLESTVAGDAVWSMRWDLIALLSIFAIVITLFKLASEKIQETDLQVESKAYDVVRWGSGIGTGYVVGCLLALAMHLAPAPRVYLDFVPEQKRLFGIAPVDTQWLGYVHRLSKGPYATASNGVPAVFDGNYLRTRPSKSAPSDYYPDLPIRYAYRRELFASGSAASSRRASETPLPPTTGRSSGGPAF